MSWTRLLLAGAAAAAALACGHAPPLGTARLVVVRTPGGGVRPFVKATVAGEPVTLLVDTGTTHSMLPAEFARARGLRTGRPASDVSLADANGKELILKRLPGVPVQFDGEAEGGTLEFLMSPGPIGFGILSPQDLVGRGSAIVIDLERQELRREPEGVALERVRAGGAAVRELDFRGCPEEGLFQAGHRAVTVTIEGVQVRMLIDTGAEQTVLTRDNPALASMTSRIGPRLASAGIGSIGQVLLVHDVPITFAETSFVLPALVLPGPHPCWQGAIGSDVLSHCTLVWGSSRLWAACREPGGSREPRTPSAPPRGAPKPPRARRRRRDRPTPPARRAPSAGWSRCSPPR